MGRRYGSDELDELIDSLRRRVPGIVLRTTVMTGFPGETSHDFDELASFVKRSRFDRLGVFAYSREEGTPAADMPDQVSEKVAAARRAELLRLQSAITASADRARIGKTYEAVLDTDGAARLGTRTGQGTEEDLMWYAARTYAEAPKIDGYIRVSYAVNESREGMDTTGGAGANGGVGVNTGSGARPHAGDFVRVRITGRDAIGLYGEIINAKENEFTK
jgi:ribosomal protein S12 methylthiotransferase